MFPHLWSFSVHLRHPLLSGLAGLAGWITLASATAFAQTFPAPSPSPLPSAPAAVPAANVTDASAFVPPVLYRSVFADTPTGIETDTLDWKKANADVGQFKRGHIDILKWEANQGAKP
jgi:hypothetical protein